MRIAMTAMLIAAIGPAMPATSQELPPGPPRIFEYYGGVTSTDEEDGVVWLSLWTAQVRFRIDGDSEARRGELSVLLRRADEEGRAIVLRYDGTRGKLNRETGTLDYPLCGIVFDDLGYEPAKACDVEPAAARSGPEAALTLAAAHLGVSEFQQARELLVRSHLPGDPAFRKLLLRVRASAAEGLALSEPPASRAADQALMAALADHQALAVL